MGAAGGRGPVPVAACGPDRGCAASASWSHSREELIETALHLLQKREAEPDGIADEYSCVTPELYFPESTRPLDPGYLKKEKRGAQKESAVGSALRTPGSD